MVARGLRSARCHLRSQFRCFLTPLSNYLTSTHQEAEGLNHSTVYVYVVDRKLIGGTSLIPAM